MVFVEDLFGGWVVDGIEIVEGVLGGGVIGCGVVK